MTTKKTAHFTDISIFQGVIEYTTEAGEYRIIKRGYRCYEIFRNRDGGFIHSHFKVTKLNPDRSDLRAFHQEIWSEI